MRVNKTERIVRVSTGHAEADMLGQVYMYLAERKNRGLSQRPHRKKLKGYTFMSRSEVARMIHKRKKNISELYLNELASSCLRSLIVLINKGKVIYTRVVNRVRKLFVNS